MWSRLCFVTGKCEYNSTEIIENVSPKGKKEIYLNELVLNNTEGKIKFEK